MVKLLNLAHKILKREGVWTVLLALHNTDEKRMKFSDLTIAMREDGSYYQSYLRVRDSLVKDGLVEFKLDMYQNKVLSLTKKGIKTATHLIVLKKIFGEKKDE